jgi:hypothetical protein
MNTQNIRWKLLASPLHNLGYWTAKAITHRTNAQFSTGWERDFERSSMRMAARHVARCIKTAKAEGML